MERGGMLLAEVIYRWWYQIRALEACANCLSMNVSFVGSQLAEIDSLCAWKELSYVSKGIWHDAVLNLQCSPLNKKE